MRDWVRNEIMNNPDHDRVFREAGITREQVWVQRTPMGDFAVACLDTGDPAKAFKVLSTSKDPWAAKFRDFLKEAHGFDLTQPVPLNEQIADWAVMEKARS